MPIGKPLYELHDPVMFQIRDMYDNLHTRHGMIVVVDAYGTFEQNDYASYDISVPEDDFCWYKHIIEPNVTYDDSEEAVTYEIYSQLYEKREEERLRNTN